MNEDETSLAVVYRLGEALCNVSDRKYESAIACLFEANEWLELLRDEHELGIEDEL